MNHLLEKTTGGRPAGHKRQALSQWVRARGRFTMGDMVRAMGWSVRDANNTIQRAMAARQLTVVDRVEQPGCKRPVALYAPADPRGPEPLHTAMASWAR
jgi:hypothetical protein